MQGNQSDAVEAVEHSLDLVPASFLERHAGRRRSQDLQSGGASSDSFAREVETFSESVSGDLGNRLIRFDEIHFFDFAIGSGESIGPPAVVGEKNKARRTPVEPTGEMEGFLFRVIDQIDDRRVIFVSRCTDDPHRFVKGDVEGGDRLVENAIAGRDFVEAGDLAMDVRAGLLVDRESASCDAGLGSSLADGKLLCNEMIEAHGVLEREWKN